MSRMSVAKQGLVPISWLVMMVMLAFNASAAVFFSDFNSGTPAGMTLFKTGGSPAGTAGVVEDGYLKITKNVNDAGGHAVLDDFGGGQTVPRFTATFKAALFGSLCCGGGTLPADGFSFNLVPATTAVPPVYGGFGPEDGMDGGLAVNFDTWDNGAGEAPSIEVKWLGTMVGRVSIQPSQSPVGAATAEAAAKDVFINMDPDGKITVAYGDRLIFDHLQTPYDAATIGAPKWVIGGRTGGANDNHWIDDLRIVTGVQSQVLFGTDGTSWKYNQTESMDGVNWTAVDYNDSASPWFDGIAVLSSDSGNAIIAPLIQTPLLSPQTAQQGVAQHAYYFRKSFLWSQPVQPGAILTFTARVDDGIVIFLNGTEVERLRVPDDAPIQWAGQDLASALACGGDPDCGEDVFSVDGSALLPGANVLSAILYQEGGNSSDVTFALGLAVTPPLAPTITDPSQPTNRVIFANRTTTLSVSYMASPTPNFQWFKDGSPVDPLVNATATASSLVITNMTAADAGSYYVVISNAVGTATSRTATVGYDNDVTPPTIVGASASPTFDRVTVEFDELLNPAGTDDPFNFTVSTGGGTEINPLSTVLNGRFLTLVMEQPLLEDTVYTVKVSNLSDLAGNLIPGTISADFRTFAQGSGVLNFSVFDGLSTADNNIATTLLADPRFPSSPSARYLISAFDSRQIFPTDTKEGYGGQMVGLFIPPVSGNWIFYLRSDDSSRLYLNPAGPSVAGKSMIIEELACCQAFAALPSAPQALTAGERYYIEAIYKEGTGGDYCQVAAKLDTDPTDPNALTPIPSVMLGYYADPAGATVSLTQSPASTSVEENKSVTLTAAGTGSTAASSVATFLWQRSDDGGSTWVNVFSQATTNGQSSFTISVANLANDNGDQYRVVLSVPGASATSDSATLTVTADTTPPSLISATGDDSMKTITLRFDELIAATSVDVFGFDAPGLTLNNAVATSDGFGAVLFLDSPMTEDTVYSVTANDVTDRASTPNSIGANRTVQFRSFAFGRGFLNFAVFNGSPGPLNAGLIGGNSVNDLVNHPTYIANTPSERLFLPAFDTRRAFPTDAHEAYGGKITGYFIPPTSGNWIFHLNADDGSILRLNPTGTDPAGAVDLTFLDACCAAFATQFSAPQALTAGQRYYIEALYKEGGGGDYCRVAARLETDTTPAASLQPIPGYQLGSLVNTEGVSVNITQQPTDQTFVVAPNTLVVENFNTGDGGYTVETPQPYEGPWTYNSATGSWTQDGQAAENQRPNTSSLISPLYTVSKAGGATLRLTHRYSFEDGNWDGGQVQVSINNGPFTAVAGAAFSQNGYNGTVLPNSASILAGQPAFVLTSTGFGSGPLVSVASLGTRNVGDTIRLRFMAASDTNTRGPQTPNWEIDQVQVDQGGAGVQSATFTVAATATIPGNPTPPIAYQWYRDNGAGFVAIPNANGATYSLAPVLADNGAKFRVEVFTPGASAVSDTVTLTVVQPNTPPRFTAGGNQTVAEDSGPQSVPWASAISVHSIDRVPIVYVSDFTTLPPGSEVTGSAVIGVDGILHLTDAVNGVSGVFTTPSVPNRIDSFDISFKVLVGGGTCCGDRTADGWSMSFGDIALPVSYPVAHEEGTPNGLVLSFDSWDNGGLDDLAVAPNIDVKVNSAIVAYQALEGVREGGRPPTAPVIDDPATGLPMSYKTGTSFAEVKVHLDPDGTLDLDFKNVRIFSNVPTGIGQVVNGRLAFAARTGGANDNHWIDDLNVVAYPVDSSSAEAGQTVQFLVENNNPSLFSGQPAISPTGILTYTPAPNACGSAVVTVVAKDSGGTAFGGQDTSAPAQFTISVTCSNDCPTAVGQSVTVDQGSSINIQLVGSDIDGDPLKYVVTQPTVNGSLIVQELSGLATYTPNPGYAGPDSFRFRVEDGLCNSADALVTITVRQVITNTPPVAKIIATPLDDFSPEIINKVLISCNGSNACLLLDGSTSFDLESPASELTYSWSLQGLVPFATGPIVTQCLDLGTQTIVLTVRDPQGAEGTESLTIDVLSVGDALDELITKINDSTVARKNKRPFIATLKAATASAERGQTHTAANQLNALKNKIRAQIARDNPADAAAWISWTDSIIDALERCD